MWRSLLLDNGEGVTQGVFELDLRLEFWCYFEMYRSQPYAAMLDSARDAGTLGRYSFIVGETACVFEAKSHRTSDKAGELSWLEWSEGVQAEPSNPRRRSVSGDPFDVLGAALARRRLPMWDAAPVPFLSGAVGYFGYEAGHFIERLPHLAEDDLGVPDICLFFADAVLAHDHLLCKSYVAFTQRGPESEAIKQIEHLHQILVRRIRAFEAAAGHRSKLQTKTDGDVKIGGHASRASYVDTVRKAQEHIRNGAVFEVCTTHRLEAPFAGDAWELYRALREINPAPFACFIKLPWGEVVSSSPERFLRLDHHGVVESRPIKGTRPRGQTPEEDEDLRNDLIHSAKDRAENAMIVDLVRNDLGRVCEVGSITVPELMTIEPYATVFQMVSTIRGKLRPDRSPIDLVRACFPGGSMTGAPKIESLKIIDSIEPYVRGVYSGSVGYLADTSALDLNVVIRTFIVKDGRCTFSVGGAVVLDSDPGGEYQETLDKAAALIHALSRTTGSS